MSKRKYAGTPMDIVTQDVTGRSPAYKIFIWNPNRTTLQDLVLGDSDSPRYDISDWVTQASFEETSVFENNDNAMAGNMTMTVIRDPNAKPIEITERTLLDGAPVRLYSGDTRLPEKDWVLLFTGFIRGTPSYVEYGRTERSVATLQVQVVDRAEKYLNKVITARAYDRGEDIGRLAVETAVEFMRLKRREIEIGFQDYSLGHIFSQLVDVEVMKGIHQMLETVGKKPRFSYEGKLVAADTDLNRPPARIYKDKTLIRDIKRSASSQTLVNSFRVLGLDKRPTRILEQKKRIAHGTITTGFFEFEPTAKVHWSEDQGTEPGNQGRIVIHDEEYGGDQVVELDWKETVGTFLAEIPAMLGVGGDFMYIYHHFLEADGISCTGVKIRCRNFFIPLLFAGLMYWWWTSTRAANAARVAGNGLNLVSSYCHQIAAAGLAVWMVDTGEPLAQTKLLAANSAIATENVKRSLIPGAVAIGFTDGDYHRMAGILKDQAKEFEAIANAAQDTADMIMFFVKFIMMHLCRFEWRVLGRPMTHVYQQLSTTAQLSTVLTEDITEMQIQNDWLYNIDYMNGIAKERLRRELIKGWTYTIQMGDDPLLETDDIIEIEGLKFYIIGISRQVARPFDGTMFVTAWRLA